MKTYVSTVDNSLIKSFSEPEAPRSPQIVAKRGDTSVLDVYFGEPYGATSTDLDPSGPAATGKFIAKESGKYDGDAIVSTASWTKMTSGDNTFYRFELNLSVNELNTLLGHDGTGGSTEDDVPYVDLMGEIEWVVDGSRSSTQEFVFRVLNDVIKGDEAAPVDAVPPYPDSDELASDEDVSFSSAGNTNLTPIKYAPLRTVFVDAQAGAGAYTRTISLVTGVNVSGGMQVHISLDIAATNATVEFRNATSGGTLIFTQVADGTARNLHLIFVYRTSSAAWKCLHHSYH